MPFVTLLGLFHDEAGLYANATLNEMRGRKFRASYIAPYAANAYFVLYACQESMAAMGMGMYATLCFHRGARTHAGDHRLRFVLNGRPYALPGCPAVDCPYSTARYGVGHHSIDITFLYLISKHFTQEGSGRAFPNMRF